MTESRDLKRKICKLIDDAEFNNEKDEDKYEEKMVAILTQALDFYNGDLVDFIEKKHRDNFPNTKKGAMDEAKEGKEDNR